MATRTAYGPIAELADGALTLVSELGERVTCRLDPEKTAVYRGRERRGLECLAAGQQVWLSYRPGLTNRAAWVKVELDPVAEGEALREKVALGVRMLVAEGLVGFSGHLSARLPGVETFWIHPAATPRSEVTPDGLCEVTVGGRQVSGPSAAPDETEIHCAVYRARRDVSSVLHLHPHYSIVPSIAGKDLVAVCGHGAIFGPRVPVYPRQEKIVRKADADRMAELLGRERAVILRGHGAVVAEGTVENVFVAALYLEENARLFVDASALGPPVPMTAGELDAAYEEAYLPTSIAKTWAYHLEKARREGFLLGLEGTERR